MKILLTLIAVLSLSACAEMTTKQKWMIVGAVVVTGAVAAHELDNGGRNTNSAANNGAIGPGPTCTIQPGGSCR